MAPVKCGECDEKITRTDCYMRCALCELYYHQQCTNVNDAQYDMFVNAQRVGFRWLCEQCNESFNSKNVIKDISQQLNRLAEQIPTATATQDQSQVKKFSEIVKQVKKPK